MQKSTKNNHQMKAESAKKEETFVKGDNKYNWYSEDYTTERSASPEVSMDNYNVLEKDIKDLKLTITKLNEKLQKKEAEKSVLKREVSAQIQLCKMVEDERDLLKVKVVSLEKDLANVIKEQAGFTEVIQKTKSAFDQAVCERDTFSQNIAKLEGSLQQSEHQTQQLLQQMETLKQFHQEEPQMNQKETVALVEISEKLEVKMRLKDEHEQALMEKIAQMKFDIQQMKEQNNYQNMQWDKEKTTLMESIKDLKEVMQEKDIQLQATVEWLKQKVQETSALEDKAANLEIRVEEMKLEEAQMSSAWMVKKGTLKEKLKRAHEENAGLEMRVRILERMRAEEALRVRAREEDMAVRWKEVRDERWKLVDKLELLEQKNKYKWYRRLFSLPS